MGTLTYGAALAVEIEDRTLQHLQTVIISKLKRDESFAFNWYREPGVGEDQKNANGGHRTVWVSRASQLYFRYDGDRREQLNSVWLAALVQAAYSPRGLWAVPEPVSPGTPTSPAWN